MVSLVAQYGFAQKLSGQWTGGFNSGGDILASGGKTEYVLEIEVKGDKISGYSYTYFNYVTRRYYVICRLAGTYDKKSKSMVVKEVEKVKANTPPDFNDCMQTHMLTYMKGDGREVLVGKWKPTYEKDRCGSGQTELERKQLVKVVPQKTTPSTASKTSPPANKSATSTAPKTTPKTTQPPVAKNTTPKTNSTAPKTSTTTTKPLPPKQAPVAINEKTTTIDKTLPSIEKPAAPSTIVSPGISRIDKRSKQIIKTIEVDSKNFRVDMYDNGQIDGDTISLYLNGKLMVSRQRLSTTPITLNLNIEEDQNELVMYAENLGTIPPNTALMVVTVGDKRIEVNISSSEQTNGAVRFVFKKPQSG
jgi:hypothetical protein